MSKAPKKINLKKAEKPLARFAKSLAVELTPEELEARSKEAGKVFEQKQKLEGEKKIFDEDMNAKIKAKDARLTQLLVSMKSGTEDREIKVSVVPDYEAKRAYTVREDTGDVIDDRPLTAEERETTIEGTAGEGEAEKGKGGRKITRKKKNKPAGEEKGADDEGEPGDPGPSDDDAPADGE